MQIITKRIKVIQMTHEEHATFLRLVQDAAKGQTVNYAETQLNDGTYLGVSLCEQPIAQQCRKAANPTRY
jgi:hypothetical protein